MRRTTVLLLCAAAFVNAGPYSRIPESFSDTHANLNSGFPDQSTNIDGSFGAKAQASSFASANGYSSSGSYASSNANANADAGYTHENPGAEFISQQKSDNANVEQIVQSGFGNVPQGFQAPHYQSSSNVGKISQTTHGASGQQGDLQYWWMGENSPFGPNGKPSGGCSSTECTASGTFNLNKGSGTAHASNGAGQVDVHVNPFLHGSTPSINSGSFQAGSSFHNPATSSQSGYNSNIKPDHSKNPFLNGAGFSGTGFSASSNANAHADAHADAHANAGASKNTIGTKNPFLHGAAPSVNSGSFSTGSSSFPTGGSSHSTGTLSQGGYNSNIEPDHSTNPFLTSQRPVGAGFSSSANANANAYASASASANANANANANAEASKNTIASGNPFFNAGSQSSSGFGRVPQTPQVSTQFINQGQDQSYDQQTYDQYDETHDDQASSGFSGLSVSCSGQDRICVAKHLCNNGYVSQDVRGLTQVRSSNQQCDVNTQVCCTIKKNYESGSGDQSAAGSGFGNVHVPAVNGIIRHDDGLFGGSNSQEQGIDLSAGDQVSQTNPSSNGYLPPLGQEPSSNVPAYSKPPKEDEPDIDPSPSGPAQVPLPRECAAALKCVEQQFCEMDGMISSTPLTLSSAQLLRRVPLSDCQNPETNIIGKCCRMRDYVDPWPTGNLPANYSGGFDEQGFPTFLNIQKNRPPTKKPVIPVKNNYPGVKNTPRPAIPPPRQGSQFFPTQISNIQNQISQGFNNIFSGSTEKPIFQQPTLPPNLPSLIPSTEKPLQTFPNIPNFPSFPNPFHKNTVDEQSSTNLKLTVIAPHTPGTQCGVKNSVQRPSGLDEADVSFGEIPWQAMILSNREKKLLCSGALIAPNAVLTAARCVDGYKPSEVSIKVGEWKLGSELKHEEPLPFEIVIVRSIVPHPGYLPGYPSNDVAILILEHSVHFDQHVDTICLSRESTPRPGMKCISTGWGKIVLQSHVPNALMHLIDVDVIGQNECRERLQNAETQLEIDNSLVCTKAHKQRNNMCQVDLGGPLACDRGDGNYQIMGVYNQDTGCLPTNQVTTFATIDYSWVQYTLANPPEIEAEPQEPQKSVLLPKPEYPRQSENHNHEPDQPCDCQKSNFPSENSQYLPPV